MEPPVESLVLAFVEDGTIRVFANASEAATAYEGIDVESGTVQFFDEKGTPLEPRFSSPNKGHSLLGRIGWVQSGKYELAPSEQDSNEPLSLLLFEARALEPNPWFANKEELLSSLRRAGAQVNIRA